MKIYKIYQTVNNNYDTYDSAIVFAESEEQAKRICPNTFYEVGDNDHYYFKYDNGTKKDKGEFPSFFDWAPVKDIQVEYVGEAKEGTEPGVLLASFNAG